MGKLEYNRRYRAEHREALAAKDRERYLSQREERIARQKIRTTVYRREERAERERKTSDLIAWHQEWLRRKKA